MTHIIQCSVENIGGAELIEFAPHGQTVTIGGPNRAGKSSAINALVAALGGKALLPADPVRHGAPGGTVRIELDEFSVNLEVEPDRSTKLRVETKEGARFPSPQAMLDRLFGGLSFNPGAFRSMEDKKRKAVLMQLAKLDLSDLDAQEKAAEADRAYKKKRAAELEAVGKSLPHDPNAPTSAPDIAEISERYKRVLANNQEAKRREGQIAQMRHDVKEVQEEIVDLQNQLQAAKASLENRQRILETAIANPMALIDEQPIVEEMQQCKAKTQAYEQRQKRLETIQKYKDVKALVEEVEKLIEAIRKERSDRLAAAPFPIEGLGFSDGDVTFNGIPFAQLSESEQWEVSTAIGFALNPKGILFMSASGGLDSKARDRIRARAAAAGVQLFLEVVDDQKDVQILIEEGKVKEIRL